MEIKNNIKLAPYTTFKIGGPAKSFVEIKTINELSEALRAVSPEYSKILVLGGGSNVLVSDNGFPGFVVWVRNKGWKIAEENNDQVLLKVAAGEVWDDIVEMAVDNNWWGIENLSHIPGFSGASVVQNIGAYGQEASGVVQSVEVTDLESGKLKTLSKSDCLFAYRSSLFNSVQRGRYLIWSVTITLSKTPQPKLDYVDLKNYFLNRTNPALKEIRKAVIEIRDRKYPFPKEAVMGNAGSFFKNSVISTEQFSSLKETIEKNFGNDAVHKLETIRNKFPQSKGIKIPTAFLMELNGLKGYADNNVQINENNPLVILNKTGKASAKEILKMVSYVREILLKTSGLWINLEPELIGFSVEQLKNYGFKAEEIQRYSTFGV